VPLDDSLSLPYDGPLVGHDVLEGFGAALERAAVEFGRKISRLSEEQFPPVETRPPEAQEI